MNNNPIRDQLGSLPAVRLLIGRFPGYYQPTAAQLLSFCVNSVQCSLFIRAVVEHHISNGNGSPFLEADHGYRGVLQALLDEQLTAFTPLGDKALINQVNDEIAALFPSRFSEFVDMGGDLATAYLRKLEAIRELECETVTGDRATEAAPSAAADDFLRRQLTEGASICNCQICQLMRQMQDRGDAISAVTEGAAAGGTDVLSFVMGKIAEAGGPAAAAAFKTQLLPQLISASVEGTYRLANDAAAFAMKDPEQVPPDETKDFVLQGIKLRWHFFQCPFPEALAMVYHAAVKLVLMRTTSGKVGDALNRLAEVCNGVFEGKLVQDTLELEHIVRIEELIENRENEGRPPEPPARSSGGDKEVTVGGLRDPGLRSLLWQAIAGLADTVMQQVQNSTPVETFGIGASRAMEELGTVELASVLYLGAAKAVDRDETAMRYLHSVWSNSKFASHLPGSGLSDEEKAEAESIY